MFHKAITTVVEAFESMGLPYAIGGSVASGVRGMVRATNDVDFLASIGSQDAHFFADKLRPDFYADEEHISMSLAYARSFNVIHMPSAFKIDVFPAVEEFDFMQLQRAYASTFEFFGDEITCMVVSPEDVILAKLRWFQLTGLSSDRQWKDLSGVVAVSGNRLDSTYLENWADKLQIRDLLDKALNQSDK